MVKKIKRQSPIRKRQTVSEAFSELLLLQLALLPDWEGKARNWEDIEGVHQLRIALRRMRSIIHLFRPALARNLTEDWSNEMRWCAAQLGPARDMDVFIDEGLDVIVAKLPLSGADRLTTLAQRKRAESYVAVNDMLDSERYQSFKQNFNIWLRNRTWLEADLNDKQHALLQSKITGFARKRLNKLEKRVLLQGVDIDRDVAEAMHQLRIECKKLRYACEFFQPLFKDMAAFIAHLKALQNLLGVMNDVDVMQQLLGELLKNQRSHEVIKYGGALIGWRAHEYELIRDSFERRWKTFLQSDLPWRGKGVSGRVLAASITT